MVTKKIHQIWVGKNPIPPKSMRFMETIKRLHPDYEYKLWTDADLTKDNFDNLGYIYSTPIFAQKADIMRYEILYKHGGIYFDIDFDVLKNVTPLLTHDLVVCNEDKNIDEYMTNAFIYSVPRNANLKNCVDNIMTCDLGRKSVNVDTGPYYFRRNITMDEHVRILETNVMYPVHFSQKGSIPTSFPEETYAVHHWDKNW